MLFRVFLSFIVRAETQRVVFWFIKGYGLFSCSHNYIHYSSHKWLMWIDCEFCSREYKFQSQCVLCSEQCITRLFSGLIDKQVISGFLGAYLYKPFKILYRQSQSYLFPPQYRLGSEFIKPILLTTNRNSTGGYKNPKCFQVGLSVLRIWQKVDLAIEAPERS